MTLNKYSSLFFVTCLTFYKDTRLDLNQILRNFFDNYTKIVKKMHCNLQRIIRIMLNSINQIRCKSTLGHLFFCSRKHDSKNICLLCTRIFVLKKRVVTYLTNWIKYYSQNFYTIYLLIKKKMLMKPSTIVTYLSIVHFENLRSIFSTIGIGSLIFTTCFILVRIIRC